MMGMTHMFIHILTEAGMLNGMKGEQEQELCPDSGLCVSKRQKHQGHFLGENRVQIVELSEGEKTGKQKDLVQEDITQPQGRMWRHS